MKGIAERMYYHSGGRAAALALVLALLFGCDGGPDGQFVPELAVHAQLRVGATAATVQVNRTYGLDEQFDSTFVGADVWLLRAADSFRLPWADRDRYAFDWTGSAPAIGPDETIRLRVTRAGFDTVNASTITPCDFTILYPEDGDTVTLADSIGWSRCPGAKGYYLSRRIEQRRQEFVFDLVIANDSLGDDYDSLKVNIPQLAFLYGDTAVSQRLSIYAVDSNYFYWVDDGGGQYVNRVTGGVGVFGSAVRRDLQLYLRRDTLP
ncbi:DUF4249 family protein [candidate division WOR-3 bacterium]|uniref:DUF4249 family protein n=1 Tax=candidate division WOR-3 bacterium TaxID=2052148 RepID=A0A937XJ45_UNCW3|nr:DUF4249 family protein [candidate division WOR-3 bacterium]